MELRILNGNGAEIWPLEIGRKSPALFNQAPLKITLMLLFFLSRN